MFQQFAEKPFSIGDGSVTRRRALDVLEHQVAVTQQTVTARGGGKVDELRVDARLVTQHERGNPPADTATGGDLDHEAPVVVPIEQCLPLITVRQTMLAGGEAVFDPASQRVFGKTVEAVEHAVRQKKPSAR